MPWWGWALVGLGALTVVGVVGAFVLWWVAMSRWGSEND